MEKEVGMFQALIDRIKKWFGSLGAAISIGVREVAPYLPQIYDLVRRAAELTPTKSDDELLRAMDELGGPVLFDQRTPIEQRGQIVADIVLAAAKARWPHLPDRRIRRAIELAYGALRP
jgi:hypothetical protein